MSEIEERATTPPASTPWVPLWDLNGGVDLAYMGSWQSGVTYRDGHVVIKDGTTYLCVRQTTAAPVPWPMGTQSPTYNTTLPANPVDGQEAILVNDLTNAQYQWRFRYNARNVTAYKWEFIGGTDVVLGASASFTTPTGPTGWLDGNGPSFTLPRPGTYQFSWGCQYAYCSAPNQGSAMMGINLPGVGIVQQWYYNGNIPAPCVGDWAATASVVGPAKAQYQCNVAMTASFIVPWMTIRPWRVS